MPRETFHSREYQQGRRTLDPIVEIKLPSGGVTVESYVDTGCSSGLVFTKGQVQRLGLSLPEKFNDEPEPIGLADGTNIGADFYCAEVELEGEKRPVFIVVLDPDMRLGRAEEADEMPLLGRGFIDHFDVLFSGIDKRLVFSK